ncbi:hypothetical protein [Saccharothrix sp. ST-888]|uniref:hypothetical protein n=1 Tax=Saccharothrix sp. ST-888 TaxID=1427391 RepID=UPI0012E0286B|nr:hypothetical protein [Saccharothrix sp. ST-888]
MVPSALRRALTVPGTIPWNCDLSPIRSPSSAKSYRLHQVATHLRAVHGAAHQLIG